VNRRNFNPIALALLFVGLLEVTPAISAEKPKEPAVPSYPTNIRTYLASGWTTLVGREGPDQSSAVKRSYYTGQLITVTRFTQHGQTISKGRLDGRQSSVWYYTVDGCWVWSGGTSDAVWNK
jgi:hypothetical protein